MCRAFAAQELVRLPTERGRGVGANQTFTDNLHLG